LMKEFGCKFDGARLQFILHVVFDYSD